MSLPLRRLNPALKRRPHRITIEQLPDPQTRGAAGDPDEDWSTFAGPMWAAAEPQTGRELSAAGAEQHVIDIMFTVRFVEGVTTKMRVAWGTRYFNIVAVRDIQGRGSWLELDCEEGLRDG